MFMTQMPKGSKTHYAIFPENYFVVDDVFLFKKRLSIAQRAVGYSLLTK